uniref:Ribosomal protein L29 n=1 Tax=Rhodogorgon sp. TaxID=2485824 RepID=A0A3G3MHX0_9FLOR|nr:ribosomal protein L29 [Rhodogorgon sp.]
MSFSKIGNFKQMNKEELCDKIIEVKKELFELKFKQATKQTVKSHSFKHKKHLLVQLLTLENKLV